MHLWSLGIEEQFYVVLPVILLVTRRWKLRALIAVAFLAGSSFVINLFGVENNPPAIFYLPYSRFWELFIGSLLAQLKLLNTNQANLENGRMAMGLARFVQYAKDQIDIRTRTQMSIFGFILLFIGFTQIDESMKFPGFFAVIPVVGATLILAAGPNALINKAVLSRKYVLWFGLISYPLYLWHWPLLTFTRLIHGESPSSNVRLGLVVLSVALAWLTYRFIEGPLRSSNHKNTKVALLVLALCIIGGSGYISYKTDGFPGRAINRVNESVSIAQGYNWQEGYRLEECFITPENEASSTFSSECGIPSSTESPTVMLWGDSYSASLYQGFLKLGIENGFKVSQFSSSGCPPVLDFSVSKRTLCLKTNDFVFGELTRLKPDILVLAANWQMYDGEGLSDWEKFDPKLFTSTIDRIKGLGITKIVVVGQMPVYSINQADMLIRRFMWSKVETVTFQNFLSAAFAADNTVRELASQSGVGFISPLDRLCNSKGCQITVPGSEIIPMSWDVGHLTAAGSEYLVSEFFKHNDIYLP